MEAAEHYVKHLATLSPEQLRVESVRCIRTDMGQRQLGALVGGEQRFMAAAAEAQFVACWRETLKRHGDGEGARQWSEWRNEAQGGSAMATAVQSAAGSSRQIMERLQEPFDPSEVKWKPQVVKDARAMVIAYVDARVVQDRLDDVLGVDGWQDDFSPLPDGQVICRLRCRIAAEWVQKVDVGGQSEQPDEGDRDKAAFSDALKRAAVKFGIGRYLYRLPHQWVDYDPQKKQLKSQPRLPQWAMPSGHKGEAKAPPEASGDKQSQNGTKPTTNGHKPEEPKTLTEFQARLVDCDRKLATKGIIRAGQLEAAVLEEVRRSYPGMPQDILQWDPKLIPVYVGCVREIVSRFIQANRAVPAN